MRQKTEDRITLVPLHPDEYAVCEILIHLPLLIAKSESPQKLLISWGAKRKRSAMDSASAINGFLVSSSSPQFLHKSEDPSSKIEQATAMAGASSPSTPLSFSPSESDEKPKRFKSKCPLKMDEDGLETVNELTHRRELLKTNEKRHYERLKAFNIELTTLKEEPREQNLGLRSEETPFVIGNSNLSMESRSSGSENQRNLLQIPVINLHQSQFQRSQIISTSRMDKVSPLDIPDLNAPPEEAIWMEHFEALMVDSAAITTNKAVAAEARHRRKQIYKMNKTAIASKFR